MSPHDGHLLPFSRSASCLARLQAALPSARRLLYRSALHRRVVFRAFSLTAFGNENLKFMRQDESPALPIRRLPALEGARGSSSDRF
jgi:hypothetical protein